MRKKAIKIDMSLRENVDKAIVKLEGYLKTAIKLDEETLRAMQSLKRGGRFTDEALKYCDEAYPIAMKYASAIEDLGIEYKNDEAFSKTFELINAIQDYCKSINSQIRLAK